MTARSLNGTGTTQEAADAYLPSASLDAYLRMTAETHPQLYALLDETRMRSASGLAGLSSVVNEFDSDASGRGDSYRRAQRDALVRWTGARRMLTMAMPTGRTGDTTVLDVLGGDGLIARALAENADQDLAKVTVLTGDISGRMVERALALGMPAVRQAADHLFLRDASVDAVLMAYGTHHIEPADRGRAAAEALRVVRPGGRVILHDFEEASPMARFFRESVHTYSAAGHDYRHFSREEMAGLFPSPGARVRVVDVYDPLVIRGSDARTARRRMCEYVADMYGIPRILAGGTDAAWSSLQESFDHSSYPPGTAGLPEERRPVVRELNGHYVAEVPRMAIVAVAEKVR